jgi:hypothetical protein
MIFFDSPLQLDEMRLSDALGTGLVTLLGVVEGEEASAAILTLSGHRRGSADLSPFSS